MPYGVRRTASGLNIQTNSGGKLGFYGTTPVIQPVGAGQAVVTLGNVNGAIAALTFSSTPTQAEAVALRDACETLADDVRALSTLIHAMRTGLVAHGLIKGAA
jgi:hypothetical protein